VGGTAAERQATDTIRYDTIGEFNVDSKAEYSALSSTCSQKKLKQTNADSNHLAVHHTKLPCCFMSWFIKKIFSWVSLLHGFRSLYISN